MEAKGQGDLPAGRERKIRSDERVAWIQPRHGLAFAREANIKPGLVMDVLAAMAGEIPAKAAATAAAIGGRYGGDDILPRILEVIGKTARKLAQLGSACRLEKPL